MPEDTSPVHIAPQYWSSIITLGLLMLPQRCLGLMYESNDSTYSRQPKEQTSSNGTAPISFGKAGAMFSQVIHLATLTSSPL